MTKTRNTLLNTQLHSPVTFLGAPRNTIPNQEIPPLPTSRVTTGSQRASLSATLVQKAPLHTTQGQALTKQSLQRVSLQKQSVGVQALSMNEDDKLRSFVIARNQRAFLRRSALSCARGPRVPLCRRCSRNLILRRKTKRGQLLKRHPSLICSLQAFLCRSLPNVACL